MTSPRFVIFASYGNDSIALIQIAQEWGLTDTVVLYSDTGWSTADWRQRVEKAEEWVRSIGFTPCRTTSIGFVALAREKKGFPVQQYQWCSYRLKIEPAQRWLDDNDADRKAVCLVGVRNGEAAPGEKTSRATFPEVMLRSENHGGRVLLAPMVKWSEAERDEMVRRAGFEVLPHRSRECKCINSNRADMRRWTEEDLQEMEVVEREIGRTIFRPSRHMGAVGVREVKRWADSPRGKFEPDLSEQCASEGLWCRT